jgi:misacylated tRNA(Ala) deacylase
MSKLSHAHPQVLEIGTTIAEVVAVPGQGSRVRLDDDLFRHACGGQPADRGWLTWPGGKCRIDDVTRRDGQTWLAATAVPDSLVGKPVAAMVDAERRLLLSRCHSLTHVLMGCLRRQLAGFISRGAEIDGDAHTATLRFAATAWSADRIGASVTEARPRPRTERPDPAGRYRRDRQQPLQRLACRRYRRNR